MKRLKRFTRIEDDYLVENAPIKTIRQMARHLGRPYASVGARMRLKGIKPRGQQAELSNQYFDLSPALQAISREVFADMGIYWRFLA